jgi:hypothetical protein
MRPEFPQIKTKTEHAFAKAHHANLVDLINAAKSDGQGAHDIFQLLLVHLGMMGCTPETVLIYLMRHQKYKSFTAVLGHLINNMSDDYMPKD